MIIIMIGMITMCNTMRSMGSPLYEATIVGVESFAIIKEEPAEESNKVGEIPNNATVQIRYRYNDNCFADFDYVNVTYNNQSGWVHRNCLGHHGEEIYT